VNGVERRDWISGLLVATGVLTLVFVALCA
jgi:hypothetical protein